MKVVGYIRVSKEEQADKDLSIPAQKHRIQSFCQSQTWELIDFYVDDGYTSKNLNRPDAQRLIRDCKKKLFDAVVVIRLDRLSRRQKDILFLIEDIFEPHNVGFKSVTQPFDTTTAFGKAAIGMLAVFAQLEIDQLIERILDCKVEAAKQGRFMGGQPPYGYIHNSATKSLEIDESQSQVVRFIYDEYSKGKYGYRSVADLLNARNIPAPMRDTWIEETVRKILINPFYGGYLPHKGELHLGKHQAIITPEKWQEVQQLISERNVPKAHANSGLLSGLVYCGECGARMRNKTVRQKYPKDNPAVSHYYVCYSQDGSVKHMIKDPDCRCGYKHSWQVEEQVIEQLHSISEKETLIKDIHKEMLSNTDIKTIKKALEQARKELDSIDKKINKWHDAFEQDAIDVGEMVNRVTDLCERKRVLHTQINEWETTVEAEGVRVASVDEFIFILRRFKEVWNECTPEEKRGVLTNMVQSIKVYKDNRVEIEWPN